MTKMAPPPPKPAPKPPGWIDLPPSKTRARLGRLFLWFIAGAQREAEWLDREAARRLGLPQPGVSVAQPPLGEKPR